MNSSIELSWPVGMPIGAHVAASVTLPYDIVLRKIYANVGSNSRARLALYNGEFLPKVLVHDFGVARGEGTTLSWDISTPVNIPGGMYWLVVVSDGESAEVSATTFQDNFFKHFDNSYDAIYSYPNLGYDDPFPISYDGLYGRDQSDNPKFPFFFISYDFSGVSGFSGFSGFSGQDGVSGFSGFSGFEGLSGFSGFSGAGSSIIQMERSVFVTAVSDGTLMPGSIYYVYDGTDEGWQTAHMGIFLQAVDPNMVSSEGIGVFLNADYNGTGIYPAVELEVGPVAWRGAWDNTKTLIYENGPEHSMMFTIGEIIIGNFGGQAKIIGYVESEVGLGTGKLWIEMISDDTALESSGSFTAMTTGHTFDKAPNGYEPGYYSINDIVVYKNNNYRLFNAINRSGYFPDPETDNGAHWEKLTKSSNNGYLLEACAITFDPANLIITGRRDSRGNDVSWTTLYTNTHIEFQWGSNNCYNNNVQAGSVLVCHAQRGVVASNSVKGSSNVIISHYNTGFIEENTFENNCFVLLDKVDVGGFSACKIDGEMLCRIHPVTNDNARACDVKNSNFIVPYNITAKTTFDGLSEWNYAGTFIMRSSNTIETLEVINNDTANGSRPAAKFEIRPGQTYADSPLALNLLVEYPTNQKLRLNASQRDYAVLDFYGTDEINNGTSLWPRLLDTSYSVPPVTSDGGRLRMFHKYFTAAQLQSMGTSPLTLIANSNPLVRIEVTSAILVCVTNVGVGSDNEDPLIIIANEALIIDRSYYQAVAMYYKVPGQIFSNVTLDAIGSQYDRIGFFCGIGSQTSGATGAGDILLTTYSGVDGTAGDFDVIVTGTYIEYYVG